MYYFFYYRVGFRQMLGINKSHYKINNETLNQHQKTVPYIYTIYILVLEVVFL